MLKTWIYCPGGKTECPIGILASSIWGVTELPAKWGEYKEKVKGF
jgi:hypothetical protein